MIDSRVDAGHPVLVCCRLLGVSSPGYCMYLTGVFLILPALATSIIRNKNNPEDTGPDADADEDPRPEPLNLNA